MIIKRIISYCLLSIATGTSMAQTNTFPASGNVGIGTTSPISKLDVVGGVSVRGFNPITGINGFLNSVQIKSPTNGAILFNPGEATELMFGFHTNGNFYWGGPTAYAMILKKSGDARIMNSLAVAGALKPGAKLSVRGKISAQEVEVTISGWPDYVFGEDYELPSLTALDAFIKKHKHLPGIPDRATAEEKGINLGEMNRKLLEKVEELTLHLIEKEKINKDQNARIEKIEGYLRSLGKQNQNEF